MRTRPPSPLPQAVRRARLEAELDRGRQASLTLVSAGPGFGKTATVASWVELGRVDHPFAWLGLDQTDDSPHAFWSGVLAAIRVSGEVPAGSGLNDIIPASVFGPREVDNVLVGLADLRRQLVLVLDDFHLITNPDVLDSVGLFLARLPAQLRLVLITRADPVLPLHRLRIAGQLVEIRSRDLTFTQREAGELFALAGFDLRDDQVATLLARTQGWAAGLRLAAMSLDRADVDAGVDRVTGSDRAIAEYLIGEVMQRLEPGQRDFLLRTSVVDRLCGDLADRITGRTDGQQVLEDLLATNAFVTGSDDNRWFTYHPLLRDLLRHRLALEQREAAPEIHRRAAAWLAADGDPIESIRYSIKAQDWDAAGRTMISCIPRIVSVQAPALASAVEPMARRANVAPGLFELIAACTYHLQQRDYLAMSRDTVEGREYLDDAPPDLRAGAAVLLDMFDLAVVRMKGDAGGGVDLATRILHTLDGTTRTQVPLARHFRAIATTNLGVGLLWTDDIDAAERTLIDAERQLADLGLELTLLNVVAYQAILDAIVGRCRRADRRARAAMEQVNRRGWGSETQGLGVHLALGMVLATRGHADSAAKALTVGLAASGAQTDRAIRLGLAIVSVEVALQRGDVVAALESDARVRSGIARTPDAPPQLRRWADVAGAAALIAAGRVAEAQGRLGELTDERGFSAAWQRVWLARAHLETGGLHQAEDVLRPMTEPGWLYREPVVAARLILAIIAEKQHRDGVALAHVTRAVDLAQPEGIRRPFLQLAGRLSGTLRRYRVLEGTNVAFVAEFTEPPPTNGTGGGGRLEHLTERELIVLRYLPTMLKAGEIADDLFVSVNTVKAHLRSMYRKLGVSNRREAVEQARAQGLL